MITLVGTGHVFNINEQVSFIIKHIWPEAVLVELDEMRYRLMTDPNARYDAPRSYNRAARYQERMASERGTMSGSELITAVNVGRMLGAEVLFIDTNAAEAIKRVMDEMPFFERMRFRLSNFRDKFSKGASVERTIEDFSENEERTVNEMRRRFPTLVRILMDERDAHMSSEISKASERHENIVVVVGDGHVEALSRLLAENDVRKIRLRELMNKERMDEIRSELWTHRTEKDES